MRTFLIVLISLMVSQLAWGSPYLLKVTTIDGNIGHATGFFVKNKKGNVYGVTVGHFCSWAPMKHITVQGKEGYIATGRIVLLDPLHDVCIFKTTKGNKLELSTMQKYGEYTTDEGTTFLNDGVKLTPIKIKRLIRGFVSSPNVKKAPIQTPIPADYYRPTVKHGSSGAPIFDEYGKVVGMTFLVSDATKTTIAVPASTLNRFIGLMP